MVLISHHVTLLTLKVSLGKCRILGQRVLAIAHTVTLQIALGSKIDSVLIAEFIPAWIVGIVTCANSVDVQLLHNLNILNHAVNTHDVATVGIQLVAVGTLNQYRLSVHQQLSALNLNVAETYLLLYYLSGLGALLNGNLECIQIWSLSSPRLGVLYSCLQSLCHQLSFSVVKLSLYRSLTAGQLHIYVQQALTLLVVLLHKHILNMNLLCGIQIHLAGDTCKAPEVLILQIATITPAHNLHCYQVLARLQILCDVELGSHLRVLAVAHVFSVHPHAQVAGCTTHVEVYLLPFPACGQIECTAIRASVVIGLSDVWRVVLECGTPRVTYVLIYLVTIALNLKQSGHGEVGPLRVVVLQGIESLRRILMVLNEVELPFSLHRQIASRLFFVALGLLGILESEEVGMSCQTILLVHASISPHRCLLGTRHSECSAHHT